MPYVRAFIAGFLSTLVFHQGFIALLHAAGAALPRAPWSMAPTEPFGVPWVISLAFWGGVWGAAIWYLMRHATGAAYWLRALIFGAIGPTLVALLVVMPLKGMALAGGGDPKLIAFALVVNGIWGLGLAVFIRLLKRLGL